MKLKHFVIIVLSVALAKCSRGPKCWGDDKNEGIIQEEIGLTCVDIVSQTEFVITNDSQLLSTFKGACTPPTIDFNVHSLLGLYTTGKCEVKYIREVIRKEEERKYEYTVTLKQCGLCKRAALSYNWVIVPKLPNGWTVDFKIKKK